MSIFKQIQYKVFDYHESDNTYGCSDIFCRNEKTFSELANILKRKNNNELIKVCWKTVYMEHTG